LVVARIMGPNLWVRLEGTSTDFGRKSVNPC
jgi:hypothetical protein